MEGGGVIPGKSYIIFRLYCPINFIVSIYSHRLPIITDVNFEEPWNIVYDTARYHKDHLQIFFTLSFIFFQFALFDLIYIQQIIKAIEKVNN